MQNTEKFMFDTIFDELDPILPEIEDISHATEADNEEQLAAEIEDTPPKTYSETDIAAARKEGFDEGKKLGANEILNTNEKILIDTLDAIANDIAIIQLEQKEVNQEISVNAARLAFAIVSKFFPKLNEQTAIDEINSVVTTVLGRLLGDLDIIIKVNPSISSELSDKLGSQSHQNSNEKKLSVISEEKIDVGDCKIEWLNGSAERNLNTLIEEIDEIILQNSVSDSVSSDTNSITEEVSLNDQGTKDG